MDQQFASACSLGYCSPHAKPVCPSAPAAPAWHSPWPVTLHINSSSPTCRVSHAELVPPCTSLVVVNGQQASRPCPAPFPRTQLPSWLTQASVHAITINCCCSSLCAALPRGCFPFMAIKGLWKRDQGVGKNCEERREKRSKLWRLAG